MDAETKTMLQEMWGDLATGQKNMRSEFEARFTAMDARFDAMEARFDARFTRLEHWFAKLEAQVSTLEVLATKIDARVGKLDTHVTKLGAQVTKLDAQVTKLEADFETFKKVFIENFARVQRNFELLLAEVRDPAHKARLDQIEDRLARIERHVGLTED